MLKSEVKKKKLLTNIVNERDIMKLVKSKFVTELYCVFRDETFYYMVMELAEAGDVYSLIKSFSVRQPLFI